MLTGRTYPDSLNNWTEAKLAHFPTIKTLEGSDFDFQPSINKQEVLQLQSFHFLESYTNICFLGISGVGKTHLATAIGLDVCVQGVKTKFILFSNLIDKLILRVKKGL
ncbi:ATP-binding protein [Enterococcus sp. AZ128]|uniref:ATP-binding protein n=1 Tax=unclassified Enterococcus TaxID=2608891 RepID=UPI003F684A95